MTYGFIGLGNMASAILRGMAKSGTFTKDTIYGYNRSPEKTRRLAEETGLVPCESAAETAEKASVIVLAVKPQMMDEVLTAIAPAVTSHKLLVSIAAGKPTSYYESRLSGAVPVVRVMPNINAKVCAATTAACKGAYATDADLALVRALFETVGSVFTLTEAQFPAFSAIGGASGAFVHLYIDALASAGVKAGLPRAMAQDIACQTVLGSAKLTMESAEHPAALIDQVCSPGGTTIEGVHTLKRMGFESAVHQAIEAIIQKDGLLAK